MIRSTHATNPRGVLSAYRDNAAVIEGAVTSHLFADPATGAYHGAGGAGPHADEGGDPQSPDGDLAVPRRCHGLRR